MDLSSFFSLWIPPLALTWFVLFRVLVSKNGRTGTFVSKDRYEFTAAVAALHVYLLPVSILLTLATLVTTEATASDGFSPASRFFLVLDAGLVIYLAVFQFERKKTLEIYSQCPGSHEGQDPGRHWFFGDMPNIRKNFKIFTTRYNQLQHERYGRTVAVSPPWFLKLGIIKITQPADVEYILKTNFNNFVKPPFFSDLFQEVLGNGIFNSNHAHTPDEGKTWKLQRKIASLIFTSRNFKENFVGVFVKHTHSVVECLSASNGAVLDWQKMAAAFTLDSIGEIGFGVELGCLHHFQAQLTAGGGDGQGGELKLGTAPLRFAAAFDEAQRLCMARIGNSGFNQLMYFSRNERRLRECVKILQQYSHSVIEERREDSSRKKKNDILSLFMTYNPSRQRERSASTNSTDEDREKEGEELTAEQCQFSADFLKDVVMSFLIAGRDTTASTLTFAFWLLAQNPQVQQQLLEEVDSVCPEGTTPDYDMLRNAQHLPYLDGVVKETLRLFPPVPVDPKFAVQECTLPSGVRVPGRSVVLYQPYVMGRLEALHTNPTKFDPSRWVGQPEPSPYSFPVFQAGRRICLGMQMAQVEAKMLIVSVLQKFTLEVVRPAPEDLEISLSLTLAMEGGCQVRAIKR